MTNPVSYTHLDVYKRQLHDFGYVDPVIWNEVTGNIVGGHQRYNCLLYTSSRGCRIHI